MMAIFHARTVALAFPLFMLAALSGAAQPPLRNQLTNHPSPYLAMHAQDPVHWQTWSKATLDTARAMNRPLLISIGYFSCHWCHVMQRESFRDAEVAKQLNEWFVPVKVDRELQPALDAYLMDFVRMTRGQAGWPLNVVLTPDGYPLLGVTYLPRDDFAVLLDDLRERWSADAAQLATLAENALLEWRKLREVAAAPQTDKSAFAREMLQQTERLQDEMEGGFGQQAKFPMAAQLQALLSAREREGDKRFDDFIRLTLDHMADLGLHDLLGGGFFRYTIDPFWYTPHYEKMLYDNAQLALLYLRAADQFQSFAYRDVGLSTVDFLLRDMRADTGYFISSFSAIDDQGREGYFYLWSDRELETLLNEDELKAASAAWFDEQDTGSQYGRLARLQMPVPEVAKKLQWKPERLRKVLAAARAKLLEARAQRSLPADTKGIAAWNGLVLSALAAAYASSGDSSYADAATELNSYIIKNWWDGKRLVRVVYDGRVLASATLDDYALVAQGLWDWNRVKAESANERIIEQLLRTAWQQYYVEGRWLQDDAPLIPSLGGRIALEDGSLPSATAIITDLSLQLESLRGDGLIKNGVTAHLEQVRTRLGGSALWYASYLKLLAVD